MADNLDVIVAVNDVRIQRELETKEFMKKLQQRCDAVVLQFAEKIEKKIVSHEFSLSCNNVMTMDVTLHIFNWKDEYGISCHKWAKEKYGTLASVKLIEDVEFITFPIFSKMDEKIIFSCCGCLAPIVLLLDLVILIPRYIIFIFTTLWNKWHKKLVFRMKLDMQALKADYEARIGGKEYLAVKQDFNNRIAS
jgi:hypothetical protein